MLIANTKYNIDLIVVVIKKINAVTSIFNEPQPHVLTTAVMKFNGDSYLPPDVLIPTVMDFQRWRQLVGPPSLLHDKNTVLIDVSSL